MSNIKSQLSQAKKNAEDLVQAAEAKHRRELLKRRIELAGKGVHYFEEGKITEAVVSFRTYLSILEEWKSVEKGNLHPSLFDSKNDLAELLLISGVFWDLSRIYDATKTPDSQIEFRKYLDKFIIFSKGMPFQTLSAESVRKYLDSYKPVHRDAFKSAYKQLHPTKCFVATALIDVCEPETLPRLRKFRDGYLEHRTWGRGFVKGYYLYGPSLAWGTDRLPQFVRKILASLLDCVAALIELLM